MNEAVIVSGARTAVGKIGGSLKDVSAPDLGAVVIGAALDRANLQPGLVDEVLLGNVLQARDGGYAARLASLRSGIPHEVPAIVINRQCSSGLEAINIAAQLIRAGEIEIAVAGGLENMSQAPFIVDSTIDMGIRSITESEPRDSLDQSLGCPVNLYHMGMTAENVAERFGITRYDQDELALISHQRASAAIQKGSFKDQIVDVRTIQENGANIDVNIDEGPRRDSDMERLSELPAVFKKDGVVTAGNSSTLNDGAAAVVIMNANRAEQLGLKPKLRWCARGVAGVDPAVMGTGPVPAVRKVLSKLGLSIDGIDLIELNEAFASQTLYCIRELGLDIEITNVNGSGISLGHPVGATGAIMTVKLMAELEAREQEYGMVTMCVGGGQGVATIFQRTG